MVKSENLIGWKEIASVIGVCVRSAQRMHTKRPIPIKRLFGRPRIERNVLDKWVDECSKCELRGKK